MFKFAVKVKDKEGNITEDFGFTDNIILSKEKNEVRFYSKQLDKIYLYKSYDGLWEQSQIEDALERGDFLNGLSFETCFSKEISSIKIKLTKENAD